MVPVFFITVLLSSFLAFAVGIEDSNQKVVLAAPIDFLFKLDQTTCTDEKKKIVQQYLDEALIISQAGLTATASSVGGGYAWAQALMWTWFRGDVQSPDIAKRVARNLQAVVEFLEGDWNIPDEDKGALFCDGSAFNRVSLDSPIVSFNGDQLPADWAPYLGAMNFRDFYGPDIGALSENGHEPRAYFATTGNGWAQYFLKPESRWESAPNTNDWCLPTMYAESYPARPFFKQRRTSMVLCPIVYEIRPNSANGGKSDRLGEIDPIVQPPGEGRQKLTDVYHKGLTFHHELMHYVIDIIREREVNLPQEQQTPPILDISNRQFKELPGQPWQDGYDMAQFTDSHFFTQEEQLTNAESYSSFCLAAWYAENKKYKEEGTGKEFPVSYATTYAEKVSVNGNQVAGQLTPGNGPH